MTENHRRTVTFVNRTDQAVSFVTKLRSGDIGKSFSLNSRASHDYPAPKPSATLTFETLKLVVGLGSDGTPTTEEVTIDQLGDLEEIAVTKEGDNFVLVLKERTTATTAWQRLKQGAGKALSKRFGQGEQARLPQ